MATNLVYKFEIFLSFGNFRL